MNMLYQIIYMDAGEVYNPSAEGLKGILIEIGKMEYRKKEYRARMLNKSEFCFPSGGGKKSAFYQIDGKTSDKTNLDINNVPENDFFREGIYRINKNAKMGQQNKTAIRRLVYSEWAKAYNVQHKVFKIHKYKTANIYDAVYKYLKNSAISTIGHNVGDKEIKDYIRNILLTVKHNNANFFVNKRGYRGSEILAHPYKDRLYRTEFMAKERIIRQLEVFDGITKYERIK